MSQTLLKLELENINSQARVRLNQARLILVQTELVFELKQALLKSNPTFNTLKNNHD